MIPDATMIPDPTILDTPAASSLDYINLDILPAGILALLGYAIVFFGLLLLMIVVMLLGKAFTAKASRAVAQEAAPLITTAPAVAEQIPAPGSAGQLKLYDTPPKTAAMLMAIVADKMGKPLNELRFISIKEVK